MPQTCGPAAGQAPLGRSSASVGRAGHVLDLAISACGQVAAGGCQGAPLTSERGTNVFGASLSGMGASSARCLSLSLSLSAPSLIKSRSPQRAHRKTEHEAWATTGQKGFPSRKPAGAERLLSKGRIRSAHRPALRGRDVVDNVIVPFHAAPRSPPSPPRLEANMVVQATKRSGTKAARILGMQDDFGAIGPTPVEDATICPNCCQIWAHVGPIRPSLD